MPSRNRDGTGGRVAVVGAGGNSGAWMRAALEEHGVPGSRVDLFGDVAGEIVLSEYAGEARVLQVLEADSLALHDLVFLCETTPRLKAPETALVVSLAPNLDDAVLVHEPLRPRPEAASRIRVADPLAVVLAELIAPLRPLGPAAIQVVALRPAAARGPEGLDELREQAVRLLRFESPPTEVFGKPLAFNLIPESLAGGPYREPGSTASDVRELLGPRAPTLTLRAATAPWFHGHVLFVHVGGVDCDRSRLRDALAHAQAVELLDDGAGFTAADGPEDRRTVVFQAERDDGGAWILALAAEAETAAARQAVAVAAAAGRL